MGEGRRRGGGEQPHPAGCESRACGNKQFVTWRESRAATAYALLLILLRVFVPSRSRSLSLFHFLSLSLSLSVCVSTPAATLTLTVYLFLLVRSLPVSQLTGDRRGGEAAPGSFTHDVTPPPPPSLRSASDVTINSGASRCFLLPLPPATAIVYAHTHMDTYTHVHTQRSLTSRLSLRPPRRRDRRPYSS